MPSSLWPSDGIWKPTLLDQAFFNNDHALRCYAEEYGRSASWEKWTRFSQQDQDQFFRLPYAINTGAQQGQFVVQLFNKRVCVVSRADVKRNPFFVYRATNRLQRIDVQQRRARHDALHQRQTSQETRQKTFIS